MNTLNMPMINIVHAYAVIDPLSILSNIADDIYVSLTYAIDEWCQAQEIQCYLSYILRYHHWTFGVFD